uniref:HAT C-terminal dimerisation domain-containing protein n=1 Tax=Oryza sativa subsp. japonica TaxID=39947 RepID=Q10K18_ORYSJ|nr:hypothetical protein LOC_Os03g28220 [Oryza sativa Japonica Group]
MEGKFLKYFTAIPHLYCFALVLDPHKKLEIVEAAFISIGDAMGLDYSEAYQHARDELFRVFRLYQTKLSVAHRVPEETPQKKQSKSSAMNLWKKIRGKEEASSSGSRSNWNPDAKLNHFLNTNHTEHDRTLDGEDVDLLEWWKEKERTLPVLAHFARDVLLTGLKQMQGRNTG